MSTSGNMGAELWIEYRDGVEPDPGTDRQFADWVNAQPVGVTTILTSFEHVMSMLVQIAGRDDLGGVVVRPAPLEIMDLRKAA